MEINEFGLYNWISPYVKQLLKGPTGFCVGGLKIEDPLSSASPHPNHYCNNENDIFSIAVPLAGDIVRWQFIFDGCNPDAAPDILFPDHEDFDPEFDEIASLANWNRNDDCSLLLAVKQTIGLYKEHHKKKCFLLGNKFKEDLEELFAHEENFNIEICYKKSERTSNQRVINVLVQLPGDFSSIVEKDAPLDLVIYNPLLLIKFEIDAGKITPSLFMPSHIGPVIAAPPYASGMSVLDYVVKTNQKLNESVKIMKESYSKRCEYVAAFLRLFSGQILEYDAEKFMKISFLFCHETFFFFIHVHLTNCFPSDVPTLTFQSAYHFNRKNQIYQSVCANYPYSPRWSGAEMAKRAKVFIQEKIDQFKENCLRNGILW